MFRLPMGCRRTRLSSGRNDPSHQPGAVTHADPCRCLKARASGLTHSATFECVSAPGLIFAVKHTLSCDIKQMSQDMRAEAVASASGRCTFLVEDARGQTHQPSGGCGVPGTLGILCQADKPVADHERTCRHVRTGDINSSENGHFNDPRGCFPTTTCKPAALDQPRKPFRLPRPSEHPADYQKLNFVPTRHIHATSR